MTSQTQFVNLRFLKKGFRRVLPNTQAVALATILIISFLLIYSLSDVLMPVFASIVLAYLLEGTGTKIECFKVPRLISVYLVFVFFLTSLVFLLFYLLPIVSEQAVELIQQIPYIINRAQSEIMRLPKAYPEFISERKISDLVFSVQKELLTYGQNVLSISAASVVGLVSAMIYLFLVPMMVFFFLKDKQILIDWFLQFMPKDRHLSERVWTEIDEQIGNYVHGKFGEVFILWAVSIVTFTVLGLDYAVLLSVLMGLQVVIPYIGATLVTFPVLGVAYFQWGLSGDDFMVIVIAYSI
ncbi:MAG: AI-2E family transporter, partial [Methylococcales bacterium]